MMMVIFMHKVEECLNYNYLIYLFGIVFEFICSQYLYLVPKQGLVSYSDFQEALCVT